MKLRKLTRNTVCLIWILVLSLRVSYSQNGLSHYYQDKDQGITEIIDKLIATSKQYLGKPYRFLNERGEKMDCSGFLSYIFSLYHIVLPKSASAIALNTVKIGFDEIEKGDLLFFKGRNSASSSVGHVSLVIEKDENHLKMIHSCRWGVIIDDYPMKYYTDRFLFPGKVTDLYRSFMSGDTIRADTVKKIGIQHPDTLKLNKAVPDTLQTGKITIKDTITIIGVGDVMLGTNYPSDKHLPPNDGKDLLTPVKDILQSADVTFGNLEGVLLDGAGTPKKCRDTSICYRFRSPERYVNYLKEAGFDMLNVANNHSADFGEEGRSNTVRVLKDAGLHFAGLSQYPYDIFTVDSVTYGFCAFAPNSGTININNPSKIREVVSHLDSLVDIVIVSFHGGAEGAEHRHITRKSETFLGENRSNPYEFARIAIDAGADVVFGHGPHVTRAIDLYKNRFIAYSLGNFATWDKFNLIGPGGMAPIIKVSVNRKGEFIRADITSIKQAGEGGPVVDKNKGALKEIINLTKTDIPESKLVISENGEVTIKSPGISLP